MHDARIARTDSPRLPRSGSSCQALSLGYFSLGQQRKVTRARSARNASKGNGSEAAFPCLQPLGDGREARHEVIGQSGNRARGMAAAAKAAEAFGDFQCKL